MVLLCYILFTGMGSLIGHLYFDGSVYLGGFFGFLTCMITHALIKVGSGGSVGDIFEDIADIGFDSGSSDGSFDGGFGD